MNQGMVFDRVGYVCPECRQVGIIRRVWLSLRRVCLEGYCETCRTLSVRAFDLMEVDRWVRGEAEAPRSYELACVPPN